MGKKNLRYAVLSERNCADLRKGVESLFASWGRLRQLVRWKRKVAGCIVALEVTFNATDGTWHPHLNLLIEGDYFPHDEFKQLWVKATRGRGEMVHLQAADAGTVRELIKYVTKIADLVGKPILLDEFLSAIKGKRLVRTYGTFYGLAVDDEENPGCACVECEREGKTNVSTVDLGYVAPYQVSLDFLGILRVSPSAQARPAAKKFQYLRPQSSLVRRFDAAFKSFRRAYEARA